MSLKETLYHLGDTVEVKTLDEISKEYKEDKSGNFFIDGEYFLVPMRKTCGKAFEIVEVVWDDIFGFMGYRLKGVNGYYTDGMVKAAEKN